MNALISLTLYRWNFELFEPGIWAVDKIAKWKQHNIIYAC